MMNKLVSIIVPAYNGEQFLIKCIDSLLNQTYAPIEIIVIYDPSQDNSLELLQKYTNRINLVQNLERTSPSIARNIGLKIAKGDYIAFCDVDDCFSFNKIETQIAVLEEKNKIGLVYCDFFLIDSNDRIIERIKTFDWDLKKWVDERYIAFSSVVFRKALIDQIGYFDEIFHSSEDFDLLIRLSKVTVFERVPELLMFHRIHDNNLSQRLLIKGKITLLQIYFKHGMYSLGFFNSVTGLIITPIFYLIVKHPSLYHFIRKHILRRNM